MRSGNERSQAKKNVNTSCFKADQIVGTYLHLKKGTEVYRTRSYCPHQTVLCVHESDLPFFYFLPFCLAKVVLREEILLFSRLGCML